MQPSPLPPIERLRELFTYDHETGVLRRRIKRGQCFESGEVAGGINPVSGYVLVRVDGRKYPAHRIGWALHHGAEPRGLIDHRNGVRSNNWIDNLRDTTKRVNAENQRQASRNNLSTGLLGAHVDRRTGKVQANIRVDGKLRRMGTFVTAEQAHAAYVAAKRQYHEGCTL